MGNDFHHIMLHVTWELSPISSDTSNLSHALAAARAPSSLGNLQAVKLNSPCGESSGSVVGRMRARLRQWLLLESGEGKGLGRERHEVTPKKPPPTPRRNPDVLPLTTWSL